MASKANVYVITGGAGGMGKAIARRLGKKGTMLLSDVNPEQLQKASEELRSEGLTIETQTSDISDKESIRLLAETAASLGKLAGLVHTAGLSPTMADGERIFTVNLVGTALLLEAFLPLAEQGTVAVCIASMSGHFTSPEPEVKEILSDPLQKDIFERFKSVVQTDDPGISYAFSKHGVILLCQALAPAWGQQGARIVSLSPGTIETPMGKQELEEQPMMKMMLDITPLKRTGKPEEIASAVVFLLSDDASYITGTDLLVDGGVVPQFMKAMQR